MRGVTWYCIAGVALLGCGSSSEVTSRASVHHREATPGVGIAIDASVPPIAEVDAGLAAVDAEAAVDAPPAFPALDAALTSDAPLSDPELVAQGNTAFAFAMYHALTGGDPTPNLAWGPYSLSVALSMAYQGAGGRTATQMASALDFGLPAARLAAAFQVNDAALATRAQSGLTLDVADSLWVDQSQALLQPFLDVLSTDYGSPAQTVDFMNAPDTARLAINQWVSNQTNGYIPSLFPSGSLTQATRVVLANATYLDAPWQAYFNSGHTGTAAFTRLDGSVVQATMMGDTTTLSYAATAAYQAVELPYVGGQLSMVVVLPAAGQFGTVEPALSGALYETITGSLAPANVELSFPKFVLNGETTRLSAPLASLGMTDAFVPGTADLSAMSLSNDLYIDDVVQQTTISVDELGTRASSATGTTVASYGAIAYPDMVPMDINRPFFFFIRDIPTGTLLFMGRVTDPTQ